MTFRKADDYLDIIDLPYHGSKRPTRMSRYDRAAQFSPFSALTGHGEAMDETARWTEDQMELDENCRDDLDEKLTYLVPMLSERPVVKITYFLRDERKSGGSYETAEGVVKKLDVLERTMIMEDLRRIPMEHIVAMEGDIFSKMEG